MNDGTDAFQGDAGRKMDARVEREALRRAIHAAYRHGYARGHVDGQDGRFDPDTATDAYLDEMSAYARDLAAPLTPARE